MLLRHALRAGNTGWVVGILIAPILGGLAYYFAEYLPALRERRLATALEPDPELPPLR